MLAARITRMSWSVNLVCVCGASYLGIWQEAQSFVPTLHTLIGVVCEGDGGLAEWHARHLES